MKKSDFTKAIESNDFKELFLSHLGWSRCKANSRLIPILVDDCEYQFEAVAERSGLQVITAVVEQLPKTALSRKIDNKLRRQAQDYISIYVLRTDPKHHQWVVPLKNVDKRDLVSLEYADAHHADFLFSKIDEIEFSPADTTTIVDVKEAVHRAFYINSEKITKDFYSGFKKEHTSFAKFISGIDDDVSPKDNHNKQWYASVMLNRLMFCYFIQKKGFLDGNVNYLREKLEWVRREQGADRFFSSFYRGFLSRLFSDGLNAPRHDMTFIRMFGRIPYLNGGMFDRHPLERHYTEIDIKDEAFTSLFAFFDKWQWHLDTRVTASGKDINPDVLGYIFEQYINDRAQMGAYYTKEDITEYIGRNTILPFIFEKMSRSTKTVEAMFSPEGWVWNILQKSGTRYLFDAVKHGWTTDWRSRIPQEVALGLDTDSPDLLKRRAHWNDRTPDPFGLPTEIWRETIERFQRVDLILKKITNGKITSVNDFITYNLDIRLFASDIIASTDNVSFIYNFYDALRSVTILDPTCGSGAFLFAAMNILEPLYYECICRLDEFKSDVKVKMALDEISSKYRSNIHYFIYKSIILRNLYGVDIMVEATEIAKLRLFLKMVAVVDVDYRDENLGLDPLPDIDFNIRCGNTLVGYANEQAIFSDHKGDIFASQDYRDKIKKEMSTVARVFHQFKQLQLTQNPDAHEEFVLAKRQLADRLSQLNDVLNHHLHKATSGSPYDKWLHSHQPFNWIAEFYDIMHGNGGFDVIIGNPPYIASLKSLTYSLNGYTMPSNANLYSFCMERSMTLLNQSGTLGMIVPQSLVKMPTYAKLRAMLQQQLCHYSIYTGDTNCGVMFEGVKQNVSICIRTIQNNSLNKSFTTRFIKFHAPERTLLFKNLKFSEFSFENITGSSMVNEIFNKCRLPDCTDRACKESSETATEHYIVYNCASGQLNKIFWNYEPRFELDGVKVRSSARRFLFFKDKDTRNILLAIFNSSLFYLWWNSLSDGRNMSKRELFSLKKPILENRENNIVGKLIEDLMADFQKNSVSVEYNKKNGVASYDQYFPRKSKPIIDEIDKFLAKHYGFTEEELDFIINYDIKYRMGEELNREEE